MKFEISPERPVAGKNHGRPAKYDELRAAILKTAADGGSVIVAKDATPLPLWRTADAYLKFNLRHPDYRLRSAKVRDCMYLWAEIKNGNGAAK